MRRTKTRLISSLLIWSALLCYKNDFVTQPLIGRHKPPMQRVLARVAARAAPDGRVPLLLASRTDPALAELPRLELGDGLRLAYVGTAGTAYRRSSDRPAKEQRKKRRYEARSQCRTLKEALGASTAQPLFLEDLHCDPNRGSEPLTTALKSALGTEGKGLLFVDGGNTFWLWFHAKRSGLGEALRELRSLSPFAYVGISAGAILAGKTCDTAYWKGWDDPTVVPGDAAQETLEGLSLVEEAIFPHHGPQWEETVARCSQTLVDPSKVLCISDEETHLLTGQVSDEVWAL